jgi:type II secretory pathway pseudopilin PulG
VELVVAISVLGLIAAGIMGGLGYGFFTMQLARENQRATQILLERAELIRLYNWDQITTPGFVPSTFTDDYDPEAPADSRGTTYHGTLLVTNCSGSQSYYTNMRMITVSLNWTTGGKVNRSRTFHTFVAKDGIQNYVY